MLPSKQQGVALISVLLVFAIATVIASEVISRNYRDIRRTANLISSKQAYHYALAGEAFARQILYRDFDKTSTDSLTETWAAELDTFDIDNGSMTIDIVDLQSRFNLNNLIDSEGRLELKAAAQFQRLLSALDIDSNYTARLVDWLDKDTQAMSDGGEDASYGLLDYLPANRPMIDKTELRLLKSWQWGDYEKIKNYVVKAL